MNTGAGGHISGGQDGNLLFGISTGGGGGCGGDIGGGFDIGNFF